MNSFYFFIGNYDENFIKEKRKKWEKKYRNAKDRLDLFIDLINIRFLEERA